MSEKQVSEKCGAHLPNVRGGEDYVCALPIHSKFRKHRASEHFGSVTWTDGGSERIRKEIAAAAAIATQEASEHAGERET